MAGIFNNQRTSFAAGEVNPSIRVANDLARYVTGAAKVENLVVMIEGILTRRPGTAFVLEVKNEAQRGRMQSFRYSGSDFYVLAFNGGKMRVLKDGGFLESAPGVIYELAVPWVEADMVNLRGAASGNAVLQTAAGKPPQKLVRSGHTNWSIAQFRPNNGPVETQNLDTAITVRSSGVSGNVTLTGAGSPFKAGYVDGVMRIDEPSQSIVTAWSANENITVTTEAVAPTTADFGDVAPIANAFDANPATTADKAAATHAYAGRTTSPKSTAFTAVVTLTGPAPGAHGSITMRLMGKIGAAPVDRNDGQMLAQIAFDVDLEGAAAHTLYSTDATSTWDHVWVAVDYSGAATAIKFADIAFARMAAASPPVLRRWQTNIYQALTTGNTGVNAPVHIDGDVSSGTGNVTWRYLHSGYGFVQITSVTNANLAAGTVLSRLPDSVTTVPTYRFWPPSWCEANGWPKQVATYDQRMWFARDNVYWLTKPTTIEDFEITALEDSAITRRLVAPDGSFVSLEWAAASGVLVQGSRDYEWLTRAPGDNDALTNLNVRDIPDQSEGSAPHVPALLEKGAIFIGKSRKRLHYVKFARLAQNLEIQEISVASRHIFGVGAVAMAWQRDPHRVLWVVLADGTLAAATFMPDEKIIGFHRHPMPDCQVEDIVAIPSSDVGRNDIYIQTRRFFGGLGPIRRFYERLMPYFEPQDAADPTAKGAWFVDCGMHYSGPPVARVVGATHLIGQEVAVFVDGAEQNRKIVEPDGGVTLDPESINMTGPPIDVVVGLPIKWRMRDLPREIVQQQQSTRGAMKRASHIIVDVLHSAGGKGTFNDSQAEALTETGTQDTASLVSPAPIKLKTGPCHITVAAASDEEGVLELVGDNALPFTLLGTTPHLEVDEEV